MPLSAGVLTSGATGALSILSKTTGGTQRNIPVAGFSRQIARGNGVVQLLNNAPYAANAVQGLAMARLVFAMPLIYGVTPADFFARAFGSVSGDTDATNYHAVQFFQDNAGSPGDYYGNIKFDSFSGAVDFSTNGMLQTYGITCTALCVDPETTPGSTSTIATTDFTRPVTGALSTGNLLGFAQTTFNGASDVLHVDWNISTNPAITPGQGVATNSNFPFVCKSILMRNLRGTVNIKQKRNATTVLGTANATGYLDLSIIATGTAGIKFRFYLMPIAISRASTLDPNYMTNSYQIISVDGTTAPVTYTDLT